MKKIKKYINKSPILNIKIKYGNETFRFNLYDELKIDENKINTELKEQPSYYGFMGLLSIKLQRSKDDKEAELAKKEAELYIEFKTSINPNTNREYSKELAEALVIEHDGYQSALKDFINIKESVGIINRCLKAFEQRSSLLQSLSANRRNESH